MTRLLLLFTAFANTALSILELPLWASTEPSNHARGLSTRRALDKREVGTTFFQILTWSSFDNYFINITVGTPPQEITLLVATGSSEFYVDAFCNSASSDLHSCRGGTFSPSSSSTYAPVGDQTFNISYSDGSTISGIFATDVFGIGDVQISDVQFGVAQQINWTYGYATGVMGLGYSINEFEDEENLYPNIPEVLVQSGVINSRLYSLYIGNGSEVGSGTVLFGAIDKSKYTGNLATINVLPYSGDSYISSFIISITGISVSTSAYEGTIFSGGPSDVGAYDQETPETPNAMPVLISSSGPGFYMPSYYYDNYIKTAFPYVDSNQQCACSSVNASDYMSLTFANKITIKVYADQLFTPIIDQEYRQPVAYGSSNETTCLFRVYPVDNATTWTMGYSILRNMYTVFDLDNAQISIAQAVLQDPGSPEIVEIPAGEDGIASAIATSVFPEETNAYFIYPMVTTATNEFVTSRASSAVGTATGLAAVALSAQVSSSAISTSIPIAAMPTQENSKTLSPTISSTSSPTNTPCSSDCGGSNTGAIAGGVVGGVAGLALIGAAIFFFLHRRKQKARSEAGIREVQPDWSDKAPPYSPPPPMSTAPSSPTPKSPPQKFHISNA